eukprot:TRINITY_DN19758_c0_g1_i17.p1 TRINITY_DN19758_c0_g1~~TRINITY_DN19758_c0_g1_i17.p1  ORF type:complete len:117 (+),score=50.98 TRINITY_DN19758_c0_g1_i17:46-351(+)
MLRSLVGSEMCIRDRYQRRVREAVLVFMGCSSSKKTHQAPAAINVVNSTPASPEHKFKLLLIGNAFAGKSSLLMRFADHNFPTEYMNTIGIDYVRLRCIQL